MYNQRKHINATHTQVTKTQTDILTPTVSKYYKAKLTLNNKYQIRTTYCDKLL